MKETIEKIVCEVINQEPRTIEIGGKKYPVKPPVASTLIEASKYISQLPNIPDLSGDVRSALAAACDCEFSADVVAILMLGRHGLRTERVVETRKLFGLIKEQHVETVDNQKILAEILLDELSWEEISMLGQHLLKMQGPGFFLGFITSLRDANLLQATKTTRSGQ